jgi:integrase
MAFIAKAVACGFVLETLTSFSALFRPNVVEAVIEAYWQANGETPSVYTIDLAWKALALARANGSFDQTDLERLDDTREELERYRQPGLTEKNRAVIRKVLVDEVWRSVLDLPTKFLDRASRQHNHAPTRAAVLAGIAVAIRILSVAPIRVGNLASIKIGENLIRPGGVNGPYWLVFPDHEVKNRTPLEFPLDDETTALIVRYLAEFRPSLHRDKLGSWLFPGEDGAHKGAVTLSGQITHQVFKATGVRLTAHQFRHAAAAILLKHRPGEYELVRRLLGHRSITTTTGFYAGLESLQATRIFGEIVLAEMSERARDTGALTAPTGRAKGTNGPADARHTAVGGVGTKETRATSHKPVARARARPQQRPAMDFLPGIVRP